MEKITNVRTGYTPIFRGEGFGSRSLVDDSTALYETLEDCKLSWEVGEDTCVAIAKVTWTEVE